MSQLGSRPNVVIVPMSQRGKAGVGCRDQSHEMSCD